MKLCKRWCEAWRGLFFFQLAVAQLSALVAGLALGAAAWAQQPAAPSDLQVAVWASSCMACHGPDGKAEGTGLAIYGRSEEDLHGKLLAFKSGKLKATMMHQHAKGYSDEELRRIARYFANLK